MTVPPPYSGNSQPVPGQPYQGQGSSGQYQGQQFGGHQPPTQKEGMSTVVKVLLGVGIFFLLSFIAGCIVTAALIANEGQDGLELLEESTERGLQVEANSVVTLCDGEYALATVEFTNPFPDVVTCATVDVFFIQNGQDVGRSATVSFSNVEPG